MCSNLSIASMLAELAPVLSTIINYHPLSSTIINYHQLSCAPVVSMQGNSMRERQLQQHIFLKCSAGWWQAHNIMGTRHHHQNHHHHHHHHRLMIPARSECESKAHATGGRKSRVASGSVQDLGCRDAECNTGGIRKARFNILTYVLTRYKHSGL